MPSATPPSEPPCSPSPPPPPTARAPGPRATALANVFNSALSHTLRACSYANFAECFPTPAKYVPAALDGLHRDFVGKLEEMCKGEFQALMDERDVIASLNELDDLIADARRRKERASTTTSSSSSNPADPTPTTQIAPPTPPHLLPPASLLAAHLGPFLIEQTSTITDSLTTIQADNASVADAITSQRAEIEGLLRGLEAVVGDVEGAAAVVGKSEEMKGMEGELEGAVGVVVK